MLTRRSFVRLTGATAGALLLPEFSLASEDSQPPKGAMRSMRLWRRH